MKQYRSLAIFSLVAILFVGYNFINAQWTAAPSPAPGNNTPAPINVGSVTQAKSGNFMANIMAAATSTWSPEYCDELGANCWDPSTGAPGGGSTGSSTITVGGKCFEPAWAVTCNWNWSGDGNDNSTYIRPMTGTAANVCASVGRSYQYHTIVLAECSTPVYGWVTGAYACNAPWAFSCSTTYGRNVRSVDCRDQYGSIVPDSNCTTPKPATDGGACSRYGGGSDC